MSLSAELHAHFARIVRMGGGEIRLLGEEGALIRIGLVPGEVEPCADGSCILPQVEVQEMMQEWLSRRAPNRQVRVELVPGGD